MTISNALKEHLNGKLDKLQANALYNETKRKELEDALKLISPSYEVRLRSSCSGVRKELDLSVGFDDNLYLPFQVQVVRYGDIHVSDADMELLLDYPNMQVGSPSFNAGLKNLLLDAMNRAVTKFWHHSLARKELVDFRATMLELMSRLDTDPQTIYKELREQKEVKHQNVLSAVREHCYTEPKNPISSLDNMIATMSHVQIIKNKPRTPDTLVFGNKLEVTNSSEEQNDTDASMTEGNMTPACIYNRKGPTAKGGGISRPCHTYASV